MSTRPRTPGRGGERELVPPPRFAGLLHGSAAFAGLALAAALVAAVVGTAVTAAPTPPGIEDPGVAVRLGIPVARTLLDLGAVAVAGLALLARLVGADHPDRTEPVLRRTRRVGLWASVVWGVAALASIALLTLESGEPITGIWSYVAAISAGKGLLLSAGCAVLSVWLWALSIRHGERVPAELRVGVALFGLLPLPLTGHATTWRYHDLSMISMELHVVAATAWAGGLTAVVLFLAGRPALLAQTLPRYSRLATWCVFVVAATGVLNGLVELATSPVTSLPGSLFTTRYGVLVLVKALCMVVIAALAGHVRFRLLRAVEQRRRTTFAIWCGLEILVLAVAFGVAAVLTRTSVTPF
jgi:copper resistance protein D